LELSNEWREMAVDQAEVVREQTALKKCPTVKKAYESARLLVG
jgi:hypothetical protein